MTSQSDQSTSEVASVLPIYSNNVTSMVSTGLAYSAALSATLDSNILVTLLTVLYILQHHLDHVLRNLTSESTSTVGLLCQHSRFLNPTSYNHSPVHHPTIPPSLGTVKLFSSPVNEIRNLSLTKSLL